MNSLCFGQDAKVTGDNSTAFGIQALKELTEKNANANNQIKVLQAENIQLKKSNQNIVSRLDQLEQAIGDN